MTGSPTLPPKVSSDTTYAAPTMATDGERVYAVFGTGDIVAYSMDGKTRVWGKNLGPLSKELNDYGYSSSLITYPGRVLVQFDTRKGGKFFVLDAKTGANLAEQKREVKNAAWASPMLVNTGTRWEAILNAQPSIYAHDPATGGVLWTLECMAGEVATSAAFGGGKVIVASRDSRAVIAITLGETPGKEWSYEDDIPSVSSPVASDSYVIMASESGTVTCLSTKTGKIVWVQEFDDQGFYSSPVIVDDRVYLVNRAGTTIVFRLGPKYEELAKNPLGEKTDCTPAIPQGRVYLRSSKFLYCFAKGDK